MTNDQYAVPFGGRALNRRATLAAMAGVGLVPILQTVAPRTGLGERTGRSFRLYLGRL